MGIESLYADGIEAGIQRDLANPPKGVAPSFRAGTFMAAGVKGIGSGVEEGVASITDFLASSGFDTAYASTVPGKGGDEASQAMRESKRSGFGMGNELRAKADEWAPDPSTAHVADQVLHGVTRVGTKVVAATTTGNLPAAAGLLFTEGVNNSYQRSTAKGIDSSTAGKLAVVEGVGQAINVVPMAGPTVKSTLGLMALAGPGTFMSQEALSRKILEQAGYHDEASRHDPLDPLGLSLSIVLPGVFGGVHIAGLKRGRPQPIGPIKTEADVSNAVQLSPQEQQISDAFERSAGNLKELRAAVDAEKNPQNKALLQAELDKQTAAATAHIETDVVNRAGVDPEVVDAARTKVTSDALYRSMPDELEAPQAVMRASDSIAAGVFPDVAPLSIEAQFARKLTDHDAAVAEYATRPDSEGGKVLNTDVARELSPDYLADRTKSADVHEPASAFIKKVYAERLAQIKPGDQVMFTSGGTGAGKTTAINGIGAIRAMKDDASIVYDTNMNTLPSAVSKIEQALDAGANVRIVHVQRDPVDALVHGALPRAVRQEKEFGSGRTVPLREHARTHRGAAEVILQLAEKYKNDTRVDIQIIDNTRGKGGQQVTDLGFVRGFDYTGLEGKLNEALKQQHDSGAISGSIFRGTEGDASPGVRSLLGRGDGSQPAREDGGNALPGSDATSLKPEPSKASKEADSKPDAKRVEAILSENPEFKVQLPGSEETLTVAKAMEMAKTEHAEEVGETKLLQAAFECALSFGA